MLAGYMVTCALGKHNVRSYYAQYHVHHASTDWKIVCHESLVMCNAICQKNPEKNPSNEGDWFIQWNLSIVGMPYKAHLVIADINCSGWVIHCQTFIEKPLFSGQLVADTHYDGRVFPKLLRRFNLSIADISEICLKQWWKIIIREYKILLGCYSRTFLFALNMITFKIHYLTRNIAFKINN